MNVINYISKTKGDANIVWLQKSNQYISLSKPVFEIFQFLAKNEARQQVYTFLQNKYALSPDASREFVKDVEIQIATINAAKTGEPEKIVQPGTEMLPATPWSTITYQFNGKIFSVSYETEEMQNWLHPMLVHLEMQNKEAPLFHFELFHVNGNAVFREKETGANESPGSTLYPARQILLHIANRLFNKTKREWLMTVHASAVTNRQKTMLFTAASGGGKTTLAALLLQKGYTLVADDLVLIDQGKKAYGFPSALSVKQGALKALQNIYPELTEKKTIEVSLDKQVRYFASDSFKESAADVYPVQEVVFVDYNPKTNFKLTKLSCMEGIQAFLEQADITSGARYAESFLDWAIAASFYQLSYSDVNLAMAAITKIFENEQ